VTLDVESLDRVSLNAYVPKLQVAGQAVVLLTQHRAAVQPFADTHVIP
jgi:hypothetical protein